MQEKRGASSHEGGKPQAGWVRKAHEWPCSGRSFGSVLEVEKNKTQKIKTLKKPLFFFPSVV